MTKLSTSGIILLIALLLVVTSGDATYPISTETLGTLAIPVLMQQSGKGFMDAGKISGSTRERRSPGQFIQLQSKLSINSEGSTKSVFKAPTLGLSSIINTRNSPRGSILSRKRRQIAEIPLPLPALQPPLIWYRNDWPISFPGSEAISDLLSMVNYFNWERVPTIRIGPLG